MRAWHLVTYPSTLISHPSSVIRHPNATMKLSNAAAVFLFSGPSRAFVVSPLTYKVGSSSSRVEAEIRPKSEKNEVLEFGWDGTTALGGAAVDSKPARMLDAIRESGEVQSSACELFNANLGEILVDTLTNATLLISFNTNLAILNRNVRR